MRTSDNPANGPTAEAYTDRGQLLATIDIEALSDVGARLRLRAPTRLPDEFMLKLDESRIVSARIRWRLVQAAGVYFPERCAKIYKTQIDNRTLALVREIEILRRDLALHKAMSSV